MLFYNLSQAENIDWTVQDLSASLFHIPPFELFIYFYLSTQLSNKAHNTLIPPNSCCSFSENVLVKSMNACFQSNCISLLPFRHCMKNTANTFFWLEWNTSSHSGAVVNYLCWNASWTCSFIILHSSQCSFHHFYSYIFHIIGAAYSLILLLRGFHFKTIYVFIKQFLKIFIPFIYRN